MKSTGIIRPVDELGRIVLPMELRRVLDINEKDRMEIFIDGQFVILHKYAPLCVFCGGGEDLVNFRNKKICGNCRTELLGPRGGPNLSIKR